MLGYIERISGPLVVAKDLSESKMFDVVKVGSKELIGEVIQIRNDQVMVQVYEDTNGLKPGEPVETTGQPLSVELAPGLLGNIFDGLERPLGEIRKKTGSFISAGVNVQPIDKKKKWKFVATAKKGTRVSEGTIIGYVDETPLIKHYIMIPKGISGKLESIKQGSFTVEEGIAKVMQNGKLHEICMLQRRPVRVAGGYEKRFGADELLITGVRSIDSFFPIAKGGSSGIPGPFGSGKTVTLHSIAKYANSNVVIYVGCGERGNEMSEVLDEFPHLEDPNSGRPLMERTVLIANTSNMPVAAREASIYTGITLAEYFRDMGYSVAVMADSTSRWAEAMREMSARLEEMPGEEGYPAYLQKRLADFYERNGRFIALSGKEGSITTIGAVSPPGGDISEPVSQGTLRIVKVYWALDAALASSRHFPSINWLNSYSLYKDALAPWYAKNTDSGFQTRVEEALKLLQREAELKDIVQLVGPDALPDSERVILEVGKMLREDFLMQNAYDPADAYSTLKKQAMMLSIIMRYSSMAQDAIARGADIEKLKSMQVRTGISRMRYVPNEKFEEENSRIMKMLEKEFSELAANEEE